MTFKQASTPPAQGYACALEVELRVETNRLIHTTRLTNTGEKPFTTDHYLHNFLRFGEAETGPGYRLSFPFDIALCDRTNGPPEEPNPPFVQVAPRTLSFADPASGTPIAGKTFVRDPAEGEASRSFTVEHAGNGQRLTVTASRPFFNVGIWITPFQLSPEANVVMTVAPGETETLVRTYEFEVSD